MNEKVSILIKNGFETSVAYLSSWSFLTQAEREELSFYELRYFLNPKLWEGFRSKAKVLNLLMKKAETFEEGQFLLTLVSKGYLKKEDVLDFLLEKAKTRDEFKFVLEEAVPGSPQANKA